MRKELLGGGFLRVQQLRQERLLGSISRLVCEKAKCEDTVATAVLRKTNGKYLVSTNKKISSAGRPLEDAMDKTQPV